MFAFATEWPHWQHLAFIALIIVTLIPEFIFVRKMIYRYNNYLVILAKIYLFGTQNASYYDFARIHNVAYMCHRINVRLWSKISRTAMVYILNISNFSL